MIRRLGTMAVIEPFQQDVSRTDDRARLCLDTHRPTAPFSTPSQPYAAGFAVCISIRFLKFSVTNVRYPVSMARLPPQRNLEADPCAEAPVPPGAGLDFACLVGGRTAGGGRALRGISAEGPIWVRKTSRKPRCTSEKIAELGAC